MSSRKHLNIALLFLPGEEEDISVRLMQTPLACFHHGCETVMESGITCFSELEFGSSIERTNTHNTNSYFVLTHPTRAYRKEGIDSALGP